MHLRVQDISDDVDQDSTVDQVVPRFNKVDPSDSRLQAIDGSQRFSPLLSEYMRSQWKLAEAGFDYSIVAVFGSQSTGKSTLLNRLFHTNFDVMSEDARQQTTKGLWLSKAAGGNLLVMDVEGTDGRERGENQDFERKSALFSLATAEVIIVNMWENMVGLYNGANMGLLKTVFEVNLQLFQQKSSSPKTLLLFIIRDFTGVTPLAQLSKTLTTDLEQIWRGLSKPEGKDSCQISDFFDFSFCGLPHKLFASEGFTKAVDLLRDRFFNADQQDFLFKDIYKKRIPADGFHVFAESIWEKITSNRDLDLPTQQQLLAQYRCDEISRAVFNLFLEDIKPLRLKLESGHVLEGLGKQMNIIKSKHIELFDKDASRYFKDVYLTVKKEFTTKMDTNLNVFFVQQLRNLHKKTISKFELELKTKLTGDETDFMERLDAIQSESISFFSKTVDESKIDQVDWNSDDFSRQFMEEVEVVSARKKIEAMEKMVKGLQRFVKDNLTEPIQVLLSEIPTDLWPQVASIFVKTVQKASNELAVKSQGFKADVAEIAIAVGVMKRDAWELMLKIIQDECGEGAMMLKLRKVFEEKFRYDDKGLPIIWKPGDDVDAVFAKAKIEADKVIDLFAKMGVQLTVFEDLKLDFIDESSLVFISPLKLQGLKDRFKREADVMFVEAKRSVVATTAKIPPWFIGLTILLGWNEFVAIMFNPVYFLMIILLVVGAYVTWTMGMVGPVFSVVQIATTEAYRQVSGKLQENGINVQSIVNGDALKNIMNTSPPASPPRKNTTTSGGSSSGISASPSKTSSESIELTERKTRKFE